ncbi:NAD(P)-binding domain-containing protein [Gordonia sp. N1V]|uniref:NAD(P)-dependent oxidoreductase n=1 Tax=Gordonia sp. N1V TaxID=3034163 RepID=UPI0023E0B50F|nr:NAD(P)-binding domain-containing protein [Gordonia sp. N1V]MDF3282987.1 NAD(P)-binding domain-containing protein [Gordonia sp. N1V]
MKQSIADGRVGIAGFGAIGRAFAARWADHDVSPVVFDIDPAARTAAAEAGLPVVESIVTLAERCEIISLIVRTDADVLDVVNTLITGTSATGAPTNDVTGLRALIVHSTVTPDTVRYAAEVLSTLDVIVIDACPTEIPSAVRTGAYAMLVGGADDNVAALTPYLRGLADDVRHLGALGAGSVTKMAKNLQIAADRILVHELLDICLAAGVDPTDFLDMLRDTGYGSSRPVAQYWESVFNPDTGSTWPAMGSNLFQKDVPLATEFAADVGVATPMLRALAASCAALVDEATRR